MPDIGDEFRQFGQDISGAMMRPVEARLAVMEQTRKLESERVAQRRLEEAAETLPEDERALFMAGTSIRDLIELRKMKESDETAKYGQVWDVPAVADQANTNMLGAEMDKAMNMWREETFQTSKVEKMDSVNAMGQAVERMNDFMLTTSNLINESDLIQNSSDYEGKFLSLRNQDNGKERLVGLRKKAIFAANNKGLDEGMIGRLEGRNEYAAGIDLSGIPDQKNIKKFAVAAIAKGDMSKDSAETILNESSVKTLIRVANDEKAPEAGRKLAAAAAKMRTAYDIYDKEFAKQDTTDHEYRALQRRKLEVEIAKGEKELAGATPPPKPMTEAQVAAERKYLDARLTTLYSWAKEIANPPKDPKGKNVIIPIDGAAVQREIQKVQDRLNELKKSEKGQPSAKRLMAVPKELTREIAEQILKQAGGDPTLATKMAKDQGYNVE